MKKHLLIFTWEYNGYHSKGGAALSRRIRQVAESFEQNNWNVTVIHRDNTNECKNEPYIINQETTAIKRISVNAPVEINNYGKFSLLRKLQTLYFVTFFGDRSYIWARRIIRQFSEYNVQKPDLIISFFTPRGPLYLGNYFSKKLGAPWVADLQDTFDEGLSNLLIRPGKLWTSGILRSAKAITHTSPEWAERDGKILGLNINVIRHAVPELKNKYPESHNSSASFKIFYGGILHRNHQSLSTLKSALSDIQDLPVPIEFWVAGTQDVYNTFVEEFPSIKVVNLGWLDGEEYAAKVLSCNCSLVIPWSAEPRQVIPSKFYELCSFNNPIWIVGRDTGAFNLLLNEWNHPKLLFDDVDFQKRSLLKAINNDYSDMFNISACQNPYLKESELFGKFINLVESSPAKASVRPIPIRSDKQEGTAKRHLLIFTWEYNGYHSKQGTALAKRPRHVAESFNLNGWDVTVIYKDQKNECENQPFVIKQESNGIKRIPVKLIDSLEHSKNVLLRRLETLYYIRFYGDRSYKWAKDVINNYDKFGIENKPDLIISFYTPRVPLYLGNYFSEKLNIPWIADLQDPIYEGISKRLWAFSRSWMKSILHSAKAVIHVLPKWAETDGKILGMEIHTIRHAIPKDIDSTDPKYHAAQIETDQNAFKIFYGGYVSPEIQSIAVMKSVISAVKAQNIHIQILLAGDTVAYNYLKAELGESSVKYLGWLDHDIMIQYMLNCNCTLVIPWSKGRIGIPSKFYEYCSYDKPIWVVGNDLGAFDTLLDEWKHPKILFDNLVYQKNALIAANENNYSYQFNLKNCKGHYLKEGDIFHEYIKYA